MYERYKNDVAFFVVYIGEAHPSDSWQLPSNIRDQVVYASPTDLASRSELAEVCVVRLGIKLPAIGHHYAVEYEYAAQPTARVRVTDENVLIVRGPLHNDRAVAAALRDWLADMAREQLGSQLAKVAAVEERLGDR